ncbi:MAG: cobalamin biosynthesis protein CbiX [Opitutus sp.]|nr:cobalamin biosynthesis protein CbiX [Opitutus sp.]
MTIALIDNGSLEPAAHRNLRAVATALSARAGVSVHAVSWKHSDRIPAAALGGVPAPTLAPFVRAQLARGEREFVFVPFFVSAQGAIGSALRTELDNLRPTAGDFTYTFTDSLASSGTLAALVAARVRETIAARKLPRPAVIVVDHGGPAPASAALRDSLATSVRTLLGAAIGPLAAASMAGAEHAHNRPLLAEQLTAPDFSSGEVVIALLFLSPGRHAGADGDVAQICRVAESHTPGLRCHLAGLVGTHPAAIAPLARALQSTLAQLAAPTCA